jgi:PBP1b-binding outer membrane lipoprotein LpoB
MTKLLSLMIVGAFAFAGCGHTAKKEDTTTTKDTTTTNKDATNTDATKVTADGQPCTQEVALECPDGQIDGCLKQPAEGDTHKCVAK